MNADMKKNVIYELAEALGTKVRNINFRDPNVFSREQKATGGSYEGLVFTESIRFKCEGLKAEIKSNGLYLVLEIKVDLNLGAWSVNEPDLVTNTRKLVTETSQSIYAVGGTLCLRAKEILESEMFVRTLMRLELKKHESLNFYKNALVYYARLVSATDFLKRTRVICDFLADTGGTKNMPPVVCLPTPFSDLNDYARHWAISDDREREEAIESASSGVLVDFIEHIGPRLPSINAYLDLHATERDSVLGSLAEAVVEAKILLETRADRNVADR